MIRSPILVLALAAVAARPAGAADPEEGPIGGGTQPERARIGDPWPQPAAGKSASGGPEILFTFDDGPDPETTPVVLDILREHGVRAVFFQIGVRFRRGDVTAASALVRRMVRERHIIANHTISHAHLCMSPPERIAAEIAGARNLLEGAAQMAVPWFRTPYGARCQRLERELADLGLTHFHWDVDPQEWQGGSPKRTAAAVTQQLARLRDDERAVVLMHDTKVATRFALPEILAWIDAENAKRRAAQRPLFRILRGDELAAERIAPTLEWVTRALDGGRAEVRAILSSTVP